MTSLKVIVICSHFRTSVDRCKAGVDVKLMTDGDGRVPCVRHNDLTGTTPCDKLALPGAAPTVAGVMVGMLAAVLREQCPKCLMPIAGEMDFNGAILAMPCRHVLRSAKD